MILELFKQATDTKLLAILSETIHNCAIWWQQIKLAAAWGISAEQEGSRTPLSVPGALVHLPRLYANNYLKNRVSSMLI